MTARQTAVPQVPVCFEALVERELVRVAKRDHDGQAGDRSKGQREVVEIEGRATVRGNRTGAPLAACELAPALVPC